MTMAKEIHDQHVYRSLRSGFNVPTDVTIHTGHVWWREQLTQQRGAWESCTLLLCNNSS